MELTDLTLPKPTIKTRKPNTELEQLALQEGLHPIVARVLAARPLAVLDNPLDVIAPNLTHLLHPETMADMDKAVVRLADAIIQGECIGLETDHDCDGQTSHAVLFCALVEYFQVPAERIRSYIGHRLLEGYGLSEQVAKRILEDAPRVDLVITADNGSSDEPRIAQLKQSGIDVIVTDHHQLPIEGPPKSAVACLNPTREDCNYNDSLIAGCMVAWLFMAATRLELIHRGYLKHDAPKLQKLLDFVAVGTVADCVSLSRSQNNRAVVTYGLKLINQGLRPCWRAVQRLSDEPIRAETLGFKVGPLLNSDGRLDNALGSVSFLLAETDAQAEEWILHLQGQNELRKKIQKDLLQEGLITAHQQVEQGNYSLCIYLEEGHSGVHGISASRIKDQFGRPTVFLAPKFQTKDLVTGSIRGIEGFHVREALQWISEQEPTLFVAFGGHAGAGGVTLPTAAVAQFMQYFEQAARLQLSESQIGPVIWTDGELPVDMVSLDMLETLSLLEPYGREFESPVFQLRAQVHQMKTIGNGTHMRVTLLIGQRYYQGVWFNFRQDPQQTIPVKIGQMVCCIFSLQNNRFRGMQRCELQVVFMHALSNKAE